MRLDAFASQPPRYQGDYNNRALDGISGLVVPRRPYQPDWSPITAKQLARLRRIPRTTRSWTGSLAHEIESFAWVRTVLREVKRRIGGYVGNTLKRRWSRQRATTRRSEAGPRLRGHRRNHRRDRTHHVRERHRRGPGCHAHSRPGADRGNGDEPLAECRSGHGRTWAYRGGHGATRSAVCAGNP